MTEEGRNERPAGTTRDEADDPAGDRDPAVVVRYFVQSLLDRGRVEGQFIETGSELDGFLRDGTDEAQAFKPPERLPEGLPPFPSDQLPQLFDLELWGLAVVQAAAAGLHLDEREIDAEVPKPDVPFAEGTPGHHHLRDRDEGKSARRFPLRLRSLSLLTSLLMHFTPTRRADHRRVRVPAKGVRMVSGRKNPRTPRRLFVDEP